MTSHPVVDRYLARLEEGLSSLSSTERQEVLQEIRSHVAEATAAGKDLDAVLQSLGSADQLAKAYSVELLMHPRRGRSGGEFERKLKLIGLVAISGIPTIVIVATLGSVGVSFVVSGLIMLVAGIVALSGNLPDWVQMNIHPVFAVAGGPVLVAIGAASLKGLSMYVRFLARSFRSLLPKAAA